MRADRSTSSRGMLALASLLLVVSGCSDSDAFHYGYQGQLLNPDGTPAADVDVYVTYREDLASVHGDKPEWNYREEDHWRAWGTRTSSDGRFHGRFNGHGTYSKWLGVVPPTAPPAQKLDAVYVVARRNGEWMPILVTLDDRMQERAGDGARELDLPQVTMPKD